MSRRDPWLPSEVLETDWAMNPVSFAREALKFTPDAHQAQVLTSPHSRGLLNCTRQWGKSTVIALKAVHRGLFRPESMILVVSPSERQSREFLRKAKRFVSRLKIPIRGDGDNQVSLQLPNGSRLVGIPGKEETVRGFSAVGLLLIDEAARVSDEMYNSVTPMLAVGDGHLWLMSTPHGKRGFYYEAWSKGANWTRISVKATDCQRISKAFLEEQRKSMGDRWYRQEYGCEFVESDDQLIRDDFIDRAIRSDVKPLQVNWKY
jgi:hypothetical protein